MVVRFRHQLQRSLSMELSSWQEAVTSFRQLLQTRNLQLEEVTSLQHQRPPNLLNIDQFLTQVDQWQSENYLEGTKRVLQWLQLNNTQAGSYMQTFQPQQQQVALPDYLNTLLAVNHLFSIRNTFPSFVNQNEYVRLRLAQLAGSPALTLYKHNGGDPNDWHPGLPTDAHILIHVICVTLTSFIGRNFFEQHFIPYDRKPPAQRDDKYVAFLQTKPESATPHLNIVSGSQVWTIPEGPFNVFQAFCLFLYHVKTKMGGSIGTVSLTSQPLLKFMLE
eukprot:GILI01017864.1.p1 GENE.GILI01017864.1~~GILI01017864.1.p1  ORF type:complete len:285 (-),score=89.00 GILI01017864.1:48-875(-)